MGVASKKSLNEGMKRVTIMQAAKELFLEQRYSSITMDMIANRSGITKRTLYAYFPSKLALFIHLFDEYLQILHQRMAKGARQKPPANRSIVSLFTILFEFTKANERFMKLYWTLDSNEFDGLIPEELMVRVKVWTKAMVDEMEAVVSREQAEGLLAPDLDPHQIIHLIFAMNKGIFIHTNRENRFEFAGMKPEDLSGIIVRVLSKGLYGKSPH